MAKALFTNNAAGTLSAAVASTDTLIYLGSGQGALFPTITGSDYFYITVTMLASPHNMEIMQVTNVSTDTLTVVRGKDKTVANASGFSISDPVELRVTAVVLQELQTFTGDVSLSDGVTTINPTIVLPTGATGTTQAIGTNNTTIATTAYADTHVPKDLGASYPVGTVLYAYCMSASTNIAIGGGTLGNNLNIPFTYANAPEYSVPSGTWRSLVPHSLVGDGMNSNSTSGVFQRIA